ncbi:MAG: Rab family GTPase, partial [Candidatus Hodarchaeota archaeon]
MKILLLGEWAVGKTCLLKSFIDQKGIGEMAYRYTVGVGIPETKVIQIPCDLSTKTIRMQIWDIAGQPKFAKIGLMYYKEAEGAMFMFDITRPKTLDSLREKWIETCYQNISEDGLRHQ